MQNLSTKCWSCDPVNPRTVNRKIKLCPTLATIDRSGTVEITHSRGNFVAFF